MFWTNLKDNKSNEEKEKLIYEKVKNLYANFLNLLT